MWKFRVLAALAVSLLASPAFAQVNGRISGSVQDPSGAPVANAEVDVLIPGGTTPVYTTKTNSAGLFSFAAIRPDTFDVQVSAPGFRKVVNRRVLVESLRETGLAFKLELASVAEAVEVTADVQAVQLASAELATTVTRQQIEFLPTPNRQVSTLFTTQAGVSDGRGPTVINGLRTSASNVTLDGVNIQDNFIRTNSLDFIPFRPTIDQISEITVAVGNAASTVGGGAAQISIVTRSGSNNFHGSAYWYNQNSYFAANEFFNNRSGVAKPFLNLNQPGAALGGRIIRDKLFFFGNWEDFRQKQQASQLRTVLTPSARQGILNYGRGANTANLLQLRGVSIDPQIATFLQDLPLPNSTDTGDGFNTSGYRFNARQNTLRRQYVTRWDYYLNSNNNFSASYNYTKEDNDRPDVSGQFYTPIPPNATITNRYFLSLGWRSTISPTLTNDLRGGFALSPSQFVRLDPVPARFITGTIFTVPQNGFLNQGRNTNTYSIQDNASWIRGRHEVSFGFQTQLIRTDPFNDGGIYPSYGLGISAANTTGFLQAQLPGINTGDLGIANSLYSTLAGIVSTATQTFNVNSPTSGFVNGATNQRFLAYDTFAGYFQDRWKMTSRLTLTLGLRYEYWTRLRERDNLFLTPALKNNSVRDTLLDPLANFDFLGRGGRVAYNADRNNFAPNVGVAYDLFGNGKTALRGGYSLSYFNDDSITAIRNNLTTNPGLSQGSNLVNLVARASAPPAIPVPAYKVPRTQADNYALDPGAALGMPDPNLRTPNAHQYSIGIQHDFKGTIFELRYVGNHASNLIRGIDFNQVEIRQNGFLADFIRARNNAFLSERAGLGFNPAYSGPGSQPLTVFPRLASGGLLTNATVQANLRSGSAGELANFYQTSRVNGEINFYANPNALGANSIVNSGVSTYNSLQFDVRRRLSRNLQFQFNYVYSKVLSNLSGDDQNRFEPFLDAGNDSLERARAPFDLTHSIKGNWVYALPVGKGQRWSAGRALDYALGGWSVNGIMEWQSGFPFSVLSQRGTLNRAARSTGRNTASTLLTKSQLDELLTLRKSGNGVFFAAPSATGTDGRAVANDGAAFFNGQAFYHPGPGEVGGLQRRMFSGPWNFNLDMGLVKRFSIWREHTLEVRGEAFNITNTPGFVIGDQDINSVNFGRITGVNVGARTMQFALYYRF
jgi:hypothetical protein